MRFSTLIWIESNNLDWRYFRLNFINMAVIHMSWNSEWMLQTYNTFFSNFFWKKMRFGSCVKGYFVQITTGLISGTFVLLLKHYFCDLFFPRLAKIKINNRWRMILEISPCILKCFSSMFLPLIKTQVEKLIWMPIKIFDNRSSWRLKISN